MHARRPIRSFVLRAGRVTAAQNRALTELWPSVGVDFTGGPLDLDALFGRRAARCLEIGFGAGEVIGAIVISIASDIAASLRTPNNISLSDPASKDSITSAMSRTTDRTCETHRRVPHEFLQLAGKYFNPKQVIGIRFHVFI